MCAAVLVLAGCSSSLNAGNSAGSSDESPTVGARMAGPVVDVQVTQEALDSKPKPWVLTTPEAAVRSYLDWTSYAYRIGQFEVSEPTMSVEEGVRVDAYVQLNLQKYQLIDQTLKSITFGKPSIETSRAVIPAKEKWTYRYVSIKEAGKTLSGPHSASYDTTYTLGRADKGRWLVDKVDVKALGTVK